jgi:hypothetical protein
MMNSGSTWSSCGCVSRQILTPVREISYSNEAVAVSGPISTSRSLFTRIDDRLRRFFPRAFRAREHTLQAQKGIGIDGAAEVPRKVTFIARPLLDFSRRQVPIARVWEKPRYAAPAQQNGLNIKAH